MMSIDGSTITHQVVVLLVALLLISVLNSELMTDYNSKLTFTILENLLDKHAATVVLDEQCCTTVAQ
jgi:hypothetical protein